MTPTVRYVEPAQPREGVTVSDSQLYQVTAPYMCAGLVVVGLRVVEAAPILGWMCGKYLTQIEDWCARKDFRLEQVPAAAYTQEGGL